MYVKEAGAGQNDSLQLFVFELAYHHGIYGLGKATQTNLFVKPSAMRAIAFSSRGPMFHFDELFDFERWRSYAAQYPLLALLALIWFCFFLDLLSFRHLRECFGIRPRTFLRLPTIFTAPFFHMDWKHLLSNSVPLAIMGFLCANLLPLRWYLLLLFIAAAGSGMGVWLFGRNGMVFGASGVVFALFGFLLANAVFIHDQWALVSAAAAFLLYGSLLLSLFRHQPQVSWAAHVWGFASGVFAAWCFAGAPLPS